MNDLLYTALFSAYCNGDFKEVGVYPKDDPVLDNNTTLLAERLGLTKEQELELSDLVIDAVGSAEWDAFRKGLIIGAGLANFLSGDKILQSIAKTVSESV